MLVLIGWIVASIVAVILGGAFWVTIMGKIEDGGYGGGFIDNLITMSAIIITSLIIFTPIILLVAKAISCF